MADLNRIKQNVAKMAAQNAPVEDIDGYIASEGVTVEDVRNFQPTTDSARSRGQSSGFGEFLSDAKGYLDGMTGQMTFGVGDEVGAAGAATGTAIREAFRGNDPIEAFGERYDERLGEIRGENERFYDENPVASTVAQVAGGMTAAPTKSIGALAAFPKWLRALGGGAVLGGGYGFAAGEGGLENRLESGAVGSAFGAGTAGVLGTAGAAARGVGRFTGLNAVPGMLVNRSPEAGTARIVGRELASDNMTPKQLVTRMENLGPRATVADAARENLQGAARAAASVPGAPKTKANVLKTRAAGETSRIGNAIGGVTDAAPDDFFAAQQAAQNQLKTRATPLYQQAEAANPEIVSSTIDNILDTPTGKSAYRKALAQVKDDAVARGTPIPGDKSLAVLDATKKILGDVETTARRTGASAKASSVGGLRRRLTEVLDEADETGAYKQARELWGSDKEVVEALDAGRAFGKLAPQEIKRTLEGMSEAGRQAYREGAMRAIMDIAEKTKDGGSAANRIIGNKVSRDRLRAVLGDNDAYNEVRRALTSEQRFAQTKNLVLGGSATARIAPEQQALTDTAGRAGAIIGSGYVPGNPLTMAGVVRQMARGAVAKAMPETSSAMANLLFRTGPIEPSMLKAIEKQYGKAVRAEIERNTIGPLTRAIIQQEGLHLAPDANAEGILGGSQ
jgi:hypothetical protein